ncbi:zinc finger protein 486-like [Aricia agestis]|uniref:zinc finger protein 486-like n=1 Tax=Aricia agestis TaxID=91739 RepID=UPI001C20B92E|nr:zinc finger protein 486-like [Aricia agestis]XP_041988071.1 zinc finger protein 486-like [Aricia agestis]
MSYKDRCRACLGSGKEMRHIHSVVTISGDEVRLSDILQSFYDCTVSEDDQFPVTFCINCVHQLTITYSFKKLIDSTAKTLTESYKITETTYVVEDCINIEYEHQDAEEFSDQDKNIYNCDANSKVESLLLFCVECKAEFQSVQLLRDHCNTTHQVKLTVGRDCEYCNEKFEDFRSLVLHRKLHLKPYICENCWKGFYNVDFLNNHSCQPCRDKKEEKSEKVLRQCDQCGKSYPPSYIKIHILTHSSDRGYSCKYCPKKFKVPSSLNSHVLWNHKRTRNYKCEECNATFITSSSRSSHIRKNHLKEKKYGCESCGKRFFSNSELQRHSLTHTGVKNFHCHLCDKSYQTRHGLNVHLKSHAQINMNLLNL